MPKFSKPKIEIPKQVRDDSKTGTKPSCHEPCAELDSVLFQHLVCFFSAFGRRTFHPRPQDGVFRCGLNKGTLYLFLMGQGRLQPACTTYLCPPKRGLRVGGSVSAEAGRPDLNYIKRVRKN